MCSFTHCIGQAVRHFVSSTIQILHTNKAQHACKARLVARHSLSLSSVAGYKFTAQNRLSNSSLGQTLGP